MPPASPADATPTVRTPEQKARDDARAPLANALLDAFTNATPDFSPDRKKVLFASRRGANREYYLGEVGNPGAAHRDHSERRWPGDAFVRFYVSLGYAFLEPNVRGSTGYGHAHEMTDNREKRADWLKDVEAVNAWTKAQPWADPSRVVVMGGSYGGYTVLIALTRQAPLWRAGVDYVGIANLFTFLRSSDQAIRAVWVDEFGDLDQDRALLAELSPLRDVDRIAAPLFVYAGQNDPRVPRAESDQVVQALRARRVPVEYQVAADEGHSLDHRENKVESMTRVARFLEDNVK